MPRKKIEIVLNGYRFVGLAHRVIVVSKGKKDEEELKVIAQLYEEHYVSSRRGGALLKGEWQWCFNPECNKAVFAPPSEIRVCKGKIVCSHYCANKVRWLPSPAPPQVAKAIEEGMMPDNKKGKEETPVVASPSAVVEVIEPESHLVKPRKIQCQCLKCRATMDEIPGNPAICPACKETSVFITVAREAPT